ncbi:MAG: phosphatase PAP2 family protein [Oscillospiraceae bacterium]
MQVLKRYGWLVAAIVVFAAGFAVATAWDLAIDQAVYHVNGFGILMESLGWYPAFLPPIALLALWAVRGQRGFLLPARRVWQRCVCALVAAGGLVALYLVSRNYMVKRGWLSGTAAGVAWLAAGVLFAVILFAAVWRATPNAAIKLAFLALWGTVLTVANQAVVYPLKTLWQRTRFDDMLAAGSFEAFTPWYRPLGAGGSSFPSGHTANAAVIFCLLVLCDISPALHRRRRWVLAACWAYVAAMAAARILIGRHFLSDTLAAAGIMALLLFFLRRTRPYQKMVQKARAALAGGDDAI